MCITSPNLTWQRMTICDASPCIPEDLLQHKSWYSCTSNSVWGFSCTLPQREQPTAFLLITASSYIVAKAPEIHAIFHKSKTRPGELRQWSITRHLNEFSKLIVPRWLRNNPTMIPACFDIHLSNNDTVLASLYAASGRPSSTTDTPSAWHWTFD